MLEKLAADGTKLLRYGRDDHSVIERSFKDFGLKILGPMKEHLAVCAEAISQFNSTADQAVADALQDGVSLASLYRSMMAVSGADENGEDRPGKGAALNNQSIVLKLEVAPITVLLAGDTRADDYRSITG